jgi:nucleotide-binding universal stress UspA family protein
MSDLNPIIVTTDGSDRSLRVLPHAGYLATQLGCGLELVQVLEIEDVAGEPAESKEASLERARARIEADLEANLKHFGVDGKPRLIVAPADKGPAKTLLEVASGAQVLAMQTRGAGLISRLLHGNVALDVLRQVDLPVMLGGPDLLPPPVTRDTYRIVATTDLSPDSEQALQALAPILEPTNIKVTLLYVHYHAPAGLDNEAERAKHEGELNRIRTLLPASLDVDAVLREIPIGAGVDTAIMEVANDAGAHAIAMSTHGASARHHVLMGSVALSIIGRSRLPVIVVRARDRK